MIRTAAALALTLSLAACAATPPAEQAVTVTGSIAYRERIALPPTAKIAVELRDVSLADAPAPLLASDSFVAAGRQVPLPFTLRVARAQLDARHHYAVSARITDADGRLMFITDTHNGVDFDARTAIDMGTLMLVKTN